MFGLIEKSYLIIPNLIVSIFRVIGMIAGLWKKSF